MMVFHGMGFGLLVCWGEVTPRTCKGKGEGRSVTRRRRNKHSRVDQAKWCYMDECWTEHIYGCAHPHVSILPQLFTGGRRFPLSNFPISTINTSSNPWYLSQSLITPRRIIPNSKESNFKEQNTKFSFYNSSIIQIFSRENLIRGVFERAILCIGMIWRW